MDKRTGSSMVVTKCQVCQSSSIEPILFLGFLPPVNTMRIVGERPHEQPSYPAQLLYCSTCELAQLGLIVDPKILFPVEYPYTSSTTKILRDNFADLAKECQELFPFNEKDLIVDIGSNDGNLLSNFTCRRIGITPEDIGKIAIQRGIPTLQSYFGAEVVDRILKEQGQANMITATNVYAHMENIDEITSHIVRLLAPNGLFISESHYFPSLVETLQYDTIYHEHLRYYSLRSLQFLLQKHGLEVVHAKKIPTHGGSIRVYAARKGMRKPTTAVAHILKEESWLTKNRLLEFKQQVAASKTALHALFNELSGKKIYGIGAPSRASTLINYVGIDDGIMACVAEVKGSHKIGKYVPGTLIPVVDESALYKDQPPYAILLSWHIADELAPKIWQQGFKGDFIVPLPKPRILRHP